MLKYLHLYLPAGRFVTASLKAALVAGFGGMLYWQLTQRLGGIPLAEALSAALKSVNGFYLLIAFLLVAVNWGIEAVKWRNVASVLQRVSFLEALRATLYAVGVGFITPNRVGESVGKATVFEAEHRVRGISLSLIASCSQLLVTLIAGCLAVMFTNGLVGNKSFHLVAVVTGFVFAVALCVYMFLMRGAFTLPSALQRITWLNKILNAPRLKMSTLYFTLGLSALRYFVFTLQFLLLLAAFGCTLPILQGALVVSVVFFYLTWLPVPTIAEPAFRGNVALFFLTPLIPHPVGIVCAATMLWIINLLFPAVVGAAWFLTDKRV